MSDQKAILESIRDIIAGSDEADVLDLVQKVNADGSITKLQLVKSPPPEAPAPAAPAAPAPVAAPAPFRTDPPELVAVPIEEAAEPEDVLSEIDAILNEPKTELTSAEIKAPEPEPQPAPAPAPEVVIKPEIVEPVVVEALPPPPPLPPAAPPEPIVAKEEIVEKLLSPEPEPIMPPEPKIAHEINQAETTIEVELAKISQTLEEGMEAEQVLSPQSAEAAKSSITNLMQKVRAANEPKTDPSAAFRSGETVEHLVIEMLKPMLKEWMDNNLPKMVEFIVQKEIQKLTTEV